jgi:HSP20 family protein
MPALWNDLFSTRSDIDRVLDGFGLGRFTAPSITLWSPVVDVEETQDEIRVVAELPGLTSENVKVSVENGVLTISGEKSREREEGAENSTFHLLERQYGNFERSFSLPRSVDPDKVKARFHEGILTVALPKTAAAKPKQIKVE